MEVKTIGLRAVPVAFTVPEALTVRYFPTEVNLTTVPDSMVNAASTQKSGSEIT